nr:MAG TPA: hypothetical protein [Caudoviricetes sp.]
MIKAQTKHMDFLLKINIRNSLITKSFPMLQNAGNLVITKALIVLSAILRDVEN